MEELDTLSVKQARHDATYLSAPPITSSAVSSVMRRVYLAARYLSDARKFHNEAARAAVTYGASPPQLKHTAVSLTMCSALGMRSKIFPNGFRWKSPSSPPTITVLPMS